MRRRGKVKLRLVTLLLLTILFTACGIQNDKLKKVKDLDFTIVSEDCLPAELLTMIEEKKQEEFKITYSDNNYLYIGVGYGEQTTGGYSITVNALYLTDNAIYMDSNLIGPKPGDKTKEAASYPYIVVKTEYMDKTVVFD